MLKKSTIIPWRYFRESEGAKFDVAFAGEEDILWVDVSVHNFSILQIFEG